MIAFRPGGIVVQGKRVQPPRAAAKDVAGKGSLEFVYKLEGELRDLSVFEFVPTLQSMAVALREEIVFPVDLTLAMIVGRAWKP